MQNSFEIPSNKYLRLVSILLFLFFATAYNAVANDNNKNSSPMVCIISGADPVTQYTTVTYTLTCGTAINWGVSCGTVVSTSGNTANIYFNDPSCTSATISVTNSVNGASLTRTVTVNPALALSPGSITSGGSQTIAFEGTVAVINASVATGGTCSTYNYQWLSSVDNINFSTISGATGQNYTPGVLAVTTYFKRQVNCDATIGYTNVATVTVGAPSSGVPPPTNITGSPDANMNWIIATGYDVSGNVTAQSKGFYDNNGNVLQMQEKVIYRRDPNAVFTHVFASQSLKDVTGNNVLSSMSAPIDYADFKYNANFIKAADGSNYTYKNFDRFNPSGTESDKTNTPDQIGGQATKGSLGWYYSANNTWEPYMPTTNYPYSRTSFYRDGSGNSKLIAGTGESYKMGSGHELATFVMPVNNELLDYLTDRSAFFSASAVGNKPSAMRNQAMQFIARDANGNETITIKDKAGNILMSGRPGTDLSINNTVGMVAADNLLYSVSINTDPAAPLVIQTLSGTGNISVYTINPTTSAITLVYSGDVVAWTSYGSTSITGTLIIMSANQLAVTYAPSGGGTAIATLSQRQGSLVPYVYYFKIFQDNTSVSITGGGTYTLIDQSSEIATSLLAGNKLNKGYYKIIANSGLLNLSYSVGFTDVSYNFYNFQGQLIATIAPNGVKSLLTSGISGYSSIGSVPYATTYTYDVLGRIIGTIGPDEGASQYVYRRDGKIRFSQNAYQLSRNRFSYTNYDQFGRPIESGEYSGPIAFNADLSTSSTMQSIVEDVSSTGGLTALGGGTQYDVVRTMYDIADNSHGQAGYIQDQAYLGGAVSFTAKYSQVANFGYSPVNLISQTWYNYNEDGKTVWKIKYIAALGSSGYKTTDYLYDNNYRLQKKVFQKNVAAETFVHYLQYDAANGKLSAVYTSTQDNGVGSATLQVSYSYYLSGGIKRQEYGGNVQGIDYTYTLQGALKAINNSKSAEDPHGDAVGTNGFFPDAFGEVLDYYTNDYVNARTAGIQKLYGINNNSSTDSYAGNVKAMTWYSLKPPAGGSNLPISYLYTYDQKYQLLNSIWCNSLGMTTNPSTYTTTSINQESVIVPSTPNTPAYDLNGNILNLQRTNASGTSTDLLSYTYGTNNNRLVSITNTGATQPGIYSFGYDQIGRETSETGALSMAKYIQYDARGNVTLVATDAAFSHPIVQFMYDESGFRIEKLAYNTSTYQPLTATYYYGDAVYTQDITGGTSYGPLTAREYLVSGGINKIGTYDKTNNLYLYELKDHLGSVRAIIAKVGDIKTASDYYPFGMLISRFGSSYRYGYQGQNAEEDGETGWNSFELRMYNPRFGRWMTIDPKSEYWSPYLAMGNDPANKVDKDGGCAECDAKAYAASIGPDARVYQGARGSWLVNRPDQSGVVTKVFLPGIDDLTGPPKIDVEKTRDQLKDELQDQAQELAKLKFHETAMDIITESESKVVQRVGKVLKPLGESAEAIAFIVPVSEMASDRANHKVGNIPDPYVVSSLVTNYNEEEGKDEHLDRALKDAQKLHKVDGLARVFDHYARTTGRLEIGHGYMNNAQVSELLTTGTLIVNDLKFKQIPVTNVVPDEAGVKYSNLILYTKYNFIVIPIK